MKLNKVNEFTHYQEIVDTYKRKGCLTNDYLNAKAINLVNNDALYEYCEDDNAFLFVKKNGFYRVYYYLNDLSKPIDFIHDELVTEILFRNNEKIIEEEISFLERCGFKKNLIRDQYAGIYRDFSVPSSAPGIIISEAQKKSEVQWASELFNDSFDKWSGDYITTDRLELLLDNHAILTAKNRQGDMLGALHQAIEKGVAWISHIAVVKQERGNGIGKALIDAFIEYNHIDDKSRYMLWVQRKNIAAINMYKQKGFKYINKSTISLIKL